MEQPTRFPGKAMSLRRIRRADVNDAPAISEVHVVVSREIYINLLPARVLDALSVDVRTRQWHDIIGSSETNKDNAVYVAELRGNKIVGFGYCSLQRSPELVAKGFKGEFQSIYLASSARRRGIGRALMSDMAHHLIGRNVCRAACWVLRENVLARKFYEALDGRLIDEKVIELHEGGVQAEVAYGWWDLNALTASSVSA
jgi:ribosomal protein S18 acetylase RimI-like enzyme